MAFKVFLTKTECNVRMDFTKVVAILVTGVFSGRMVDCLVLVAPGF